MCLRALGIMLPSPSGSITAILGRETPHNISLWDSFDSNVEKRSRHCVVHTMHESVRQEAMRRISAKNQPLDESKLCIKARAEMEANAKHGFNFLNQGHNSDVEFQKQTQDSPHMALAPHNRESENTAVGEIPKLRFSKSVVSLWRQRQEEEENSEKPDS